MHVIFLLFSDFYMENYVHGTVVISKETNIEILNLSPVGNQLNLDAMIKFVFEGKL